MYWKYSKRAISSFNTQKIVSQSLNFLAYNKYENIVSQIRGLPSVLLCTGKWGCSGDSRLSRRLSKLSKTPLLLSDLWPMQESNMKTLKIKFTYLRLYFFFRSSNILKHPLLNNIPPGYHPRQIATDSSTVAQQMNWTSHSILVRIMQYFSMNIFSFTLKRSAEHSTSYNWNKISSSLLPIRYHIMNSRDRELNLCILRSLN